MRSTTGRSGNILIVVDSLQLMVAMMRAQRAELVLGEGAVTPGSQLTRWDVDTLTSRLKALARELDVTLLATFEHYVSHRGLFSELSESDPVMRDLLYNTQFADAVMVLTRQGNSLLNLRDHFKTHYAGTPREPELKPLLAKLGGIEKDYGATPAFETLESEFIVLDFVKNRAGTLEKALFIYHKPVSSFEPLEYLEPLPEA